MQKFSLKQANAVITDSNSSKEDIKQLIGIKDNKISVVPLAAGEKFSDLGYRSKDISGSLKSNILNLKSKYKLPEKFVLYVGDVTWNKNLPRLLDSIIEAKVPLVMVGKSLISEDFDKTNPWNHDLIRINEIIDSLGSKTDDLRSRKSAQFINHKSLIINHQVLRLGFVPDEDLVALYNIATVFVMPSLYEGFGLPVLEAMACGCPVVTSREGSLSEVAGEAAFFVDAYDYKDIAGGIKKVFESESLQKELSEKGLKRARDFSWKKSAELTLDVYRQAIK
jgi:glycosyltransferase involved in cell wall biosynthesis